MSSSGRPKPPWVLRYGLAILSVMLALAVTLWLHGSTIRSPLFVLAVLLTAWYSGTGPGLLSVALSTLAIDYYLLPPAESLLRISISNLLELAVFTVATVVVVGFVRAQQRAQEALRDAHADLEARNRKVHDQARLLDLTHDSLFVRDANDVISYWNRGAEERYGWPAADAVGQVSHQLLKTVFPAALPEIEAELQRTGRWEGELVHTRRDGSRIVVASRWSSQRDEAGRPVGILETNNDITERRRAEEALQKAQAELAHVTRVMTLGEITGSIAHEVNQPLAAVITSANACRRWLDAHPPNLPEAREAVEHIISDGNRASEVIRRIRSLLQRQTPEKTTLDVNDLITATITLTRTELARQQVLVRTELARDLPLVVGDRVGLEQVLVNLILNAVDAMAAVDRSARVLTISSRGHASGAVLVEVQDTGKGCDPEQLGRIFQPFYSSKANGLGMGLAISRSIVEAHAGQLWATPNDGAGLTMRFTLPPQAGGTS